MFPNKKVYQFWRKKKGNRGKILIIALISKINPNKVVLELLRKDFSVTSNNLFTKIIIIIYLLNSKSIRI